VQPHITPLLATLDSNITPLLATLDSNECPALVLGDFNINALDSNHKNTLLNFPQYITDSTCTTGSLLDHVYWTGNAAAIKCEIIGCYWSDHFIVSVYIDCHKTTQISASHNMTNTQNIAIPNTQTTKSNSCASPGSFSLRSNKSMQVQQLDNNVDTISQCTLLISPHSSPSAVDTCLQRMSISEDEDCFVNSPETAQNVYSSLASLSGNFKEIHSQIQHSSCPIDVRLNRISITKEDECFAAEEDECVIAHKSNHLNQVSIVEEDESVSLIEPITYNDYNLLALHFDGLMGNKTQTTVSVDSSDFLFQLSLAKYSSPPDGHCLLHTWEVSTGTNFLKS